MRKLSAILIFCFLFCHTNFSFSQAPIVEWQKCLGSDNGDYARSVWPTTDGGYIIAGYTESNGGDVIGYHGNLYINDIWIVKLNSTGAIQWQKCLGGIYQEDGADIRQTPDGGYIVAGSSASPDCQGAISHYGLDYWVVKLSPAGDIQWQKKLGGNKNEYAYSIDLTNDGGYVIAGHSESTDGDVTGNHGSRDYWVVKLDGIGNLQWQKSLGGSGDEEAYSVRATGDGGCIVAGLTDSNDGDVSGNHGKRDYWIVKLDNTGALQWQKALGGSAFDEAWSIQITPDGYIVAGTSSSNDGDVSGNHQSLGAFSDGWVVKLNTTGTIQWQKCYGGSFNERINYVQLTSDGGYVVTGLAESSDGDVPCNAGVDDVWVFKINSTGNLEWKKTLGGRIFDEASCVQPLTDGNYILVGHTCSDNVSGYHPHNQYNGTCADFWILKLSAAAGGALPQPSVTISPSKVCAGVPSTLFALAFNAGISPTYQWKRNGTVVGTNSASYTASDFADNDVVTCTILSGGPCDNTQLQASATDTITINKKILTPSVNITASNTFLCGCTPVTFKSTVSNGGTAPVYQWKLNGVNTDGNADTYIGNFFKPGDIITCVYSDSSGCIPNGSVTSNAIQLNSTTSQQPTVSITGSSDSICTGSTVTLTAVTVNAGSNPSFQWKLNNTNTGTNSSSFNSSALVNNDVVTCSITTDPQFTCASTTTATSNAIKITVRGKVDPSVSISASNDTICQGATVIFTATAANAGSHPSYQWEINGAKAGSNSTSFTSSLLADGDKVQCKVTTDPLFTCANTPNATSNSIAMTVKNRPNPSVTITTANNDVCKGTYILFTASAQEAGTLPSYQWILNGTPVNNTNSPVFTSNTLSNGDQVSCRVVPQGDVCSTTPVSSNTIIAVINDLPIVRVSPADTTINVGNRVFLRSEVTGNITSYQWSPEDKLEAPVSLRPSTIGLMDNIVYSLTVENDKGCRADSKAIIRVIKQLFMPNAFTPNGDGVNDVFRIPPRTSFSLKEFSVFDRWGNRVFSTQNINEGWDGTLKGVWLNEGIYVYVIKGSNDKGEVVLKGQVALIR
jgi:gliding motility-associated-like protein